MEGISYLILNALIWFHNRLSCCWITIGESTPSRKSKFCKSKFSHQCTLACKCLWNTNNKLITNWRNYICTRMKVSQLHHQIEKLAIIKTTNRRNHQRICMLITNHKYNWATTTKQSAKAYNILDHFLIA